MYLNIICIELERTSDNMCLIWSRWSHEVRMIPSSHAVLVAPQNLWRGCPVAVARLEQLRLSEESLPEVRALLQPLPNHVEW